MTIEEIYKKGEISVRSYNVCRYSNLSSIQALKEYFSVNKSFENLKNCGKKSNDELIEICKSYFLNEVDSLINEKPDLIPNDPLESIINNLTRIQRETINSFIHINLNSLSVRSKNAISFYLNGNFKIKNFAERVLLDINFSTKRIKNIGAKSVLELDNYIIIIKDFIYQVAKIKQEKQLISLKNNFLIQRTFSISKTPDKILETESIFLLTDFLIDHYALFDETQTYILKKSLKLYQEQKELTLDEIAIEVKLSRERVRQIRKICLENLFCKLLFIRNFNDDLFQKYNIDTNANQVVINQELVRKINFTNLTYLSQEFITYILYVYLSERFALIGNIEDVIQPKYFNARNRHNWNNLYLVEKELTLKFDFNSFVNNISNRVSDRIEESYSFNFKSFLSKFLTHNNIDSLYLLFPICERIINEEFEIYLDLDENINFKRNTARQAHEYAFEALEHLGKPSKVKEIYEKVLELHPNYYTEEEKIRVSMKRKNGFVPIGRKSVFGLKKWENELDNFRGGTIREIVREFLMKHEEPKSYSEVTEYVLMFRPKSNLKSIIHNLKLDETGLYEFYKNSKVGLSTKKYSKNFIKVALDNKYDRKSWEERYESLKDFTKENNRLPFSYGVSEKEIKLYRWLNVQKGKQNTGKLNKNKIEKLNSLLTNYPRNNGRGRLNSNEKYKELISFVSNNHRLPSAKKNNEVNLYQFFYKQRKLFNKKELDADEEIQFIQVAKILNRNEQIDKFNQSSEWESKLLYWSKYKKEGYKYSPKKDAWWKNKLT